MDVRPVSVTATTKLWYAVSKKGDVFWFNLGRFEVTYKGYYVGTRWSWVYSSSSSFPGPIIHAVAIRRSSASAKG